MRRGVHDYGMLHGKRHLADALKVMTLIDGRELIRKDAIWANPI